jgi:hypothetical protein
MGSWRLRLVCFWNWRWAGFTFAASRLTTPLPAGATTSEVNGLCRLRDPSWLARCLRGTFSGLGAFCGPVLVPTRLGPATSQQAVADRAEWKRSRTSSFRQTARRSAPRALQVRMCPVLIAVFPYRVADDAGYVCPTAGTDRIPCSPGRFSSSLVSCTDTIPGLWCDLACPSPRLCFAGRFGNTSALISGNCTAICPAGHFCPPASTSGGANSCGSIALYCPAGSAAPLVVAAGRYSTPESADPVLRWSTSACPPGQWCVGGVRRVCDYGKFARGLGNSQCSECAPGRFIDNTTTCSLCLPGYFCSHGPLVDCGDPSVYCPAGSPQPLLIQPGNYSLPATTDSSRRWGSASCQPGSFCQGGLSRACDHGTYSSGLSATVCQRCIPGRFSLKSGTSQFLSCGR